MFSIENSLLLVIDAQGKLASLIDEKEKTLTNISRLIQASKILNVPIIYTEQVPKKVGTTIPEIKKNLEGIEPIIKSTFSCCREKEFLNQLKEHHRKEIIIVGIEAHVCVYQTAVELLEKNYQIQVITDAISSRTIENKNTAIDHLRSIGIQISCTEMIITELLGGAEHKNFREVLSLIK